MLIMSFFYFEYNIFFMFWLFYILKVRNRVFKELEGKLGESVVLGYGGRKFCKGRVINNIECNRD